MSVFHQNILAGASGASGAGDPLYVDDVFSTFLYNGSNSAQTITNGIDLDGEGGMVWIKSRTSTDSHVITDSAKSLNNYLYADTNQGNFNRSDVVTSFNSNGFSVGTFLPVNYNNYKFCSWTFRKAPGFFDVVTWTGNGSVRTISHNLGSTPGWILIKRYSSSEDWTCYHRSIGATDFIQLNGDNNGAANSVDLEQFMNDTEPTSTHFTVGTHDRVNTNGQSYVAYIFAHDDQSFGANGDEAIIKCDKYTGSGSANKEVSVGFEPQFLIVKKYDGSSQGRWFMVDMMRGMPDTSSGTAYLAANRSTAELTFGIFVPTADGFRILSTGAESNASGTNYAYIAIRRPNKPPEAGTEVFDPRTASSYSQDSDIPCGFAPDFMIATARGTTLTNYAEGRLTDNWFDTSNNNAENTTNYFKWDGEGGKINLPTSAFSQNPIFWQFRRASGFFDSVTYTGNNTSGRTLNHNLDAVPEFMVLKRRDAGTPWYIYHKDTGAGNLFQGWDNAATMDIDTILNDTAPTSSVFTLGNSSHVNGSGDTYVAYLWGSVDGVSKLGSYSGTGSNIDVNCGFSAGARFVLIKRTDSTGDWYVWDTARGIVSGNDPYLLLNSSAAEVTNTDYIDPLNSGFTVTSSAPAALNASGGTYIFLAIA